MTSGSAPNRASLAAAYDSLDPLDPSWLETAIDYAATPEGRARISHDLEIAEFAHDRSRAVRLNIALRRGESLTETRADIARQRTESRGRPRTLQRADRDRVKDTFGVADSQVLRDHMISLILAGLSRSEARRHLIFIGGTALSRTYLPLLRLSEDIDLLTTIDRRETAEMAQSAINAALARGHGEVRWLPGLPDTTGATPAVLATTDGAIIRIQLLPAHDYPAWPTAQHQLIQRYTDVPPAELTTYTAAGFAASKTNTWYNRRAPRDLYDLWGLGQHGHIGPEAARLYATLGPTGKAPNPDTLFDRGPSAADWTNSLGHQGRILISPDTALKEVREAWQSAVA